MPLFMTEEELLQSDASSVAAKADEIILDLRQQLDIAMAEADAASIASDQTYNVLEQRYASLSDELARVQSESARASADVDQGLSKIAELQAAKNELHLKSIAKDGEIQRLKLELSELQKSNRKLLELVSLKDTEIGEKNDVIKSYFDKIVKLTENANEKESMLHENEAETNRSRAMCSRLLQEKELLEKHNTWLNEELTEKVNSLVELRRVYMDFEADMAAKHAEAERNFNDCSNSLRQSEERFREVSTKLAAVEEELSSCKHAAAKNEQQYSAELSTVSKLVELYKESSETWSKKSTHLEGVIKALETHSSQVEIDYENKLEEGASARKDLEKDIANMKEKLERCEIELEKARKDSEKNLLSGSIWNADALAEVGQNAIEVNDQNGNSALDIMRKPIGISGTALAASLLRDGWSLAKMYEKYQETADALRHEKWGRKHSEALLEQVLHEIEEKAVIILEERVEHEKMAEAYTSLNKKLHQARLEHDAYEASLRNLKAELKKHERDYGILQKENSDLQRQVAVLLKECRDIQIRCGMVSNDPLPARSSENAVDIGAEEEWTFKGIMDLVQHNCQLKNLVQTLTSDQEHSLSELKESFQIELQKQENEAAFKVEAVLKRCEEQGLMIESLHASVAMYKKLYEEEHGARKSNSISSEAPSGGNKDLLVLFEQTQEASKKAHEEAVIKVRSLEEDLSKLRNELLATKLERDKFLMDAKQARKKMNDFMIEFDRQKNESSGVSARNVELSQRIIDQQKKLRENTDSLCASEERCRKLSVEISTLKNEKEIILSSEKRANDEIQNLTKRVYRLQSTLDTIQAVETVHEESRSRERRRLEEHVQHVEKEWAAVKKELQEYRDRVRVLEAEREKIIEDSMKQVDELQKKLFDSLHTVTIAEARASSAEGRLASLEFFVNTVDKSTTSRKENDGSNLAENEETSSLLKLRQEMEKIKEEAEANKAYMLQYKEIAHTNEVALKQIEFAHEEYKSEAEKLKVSLESEILSLREKVAQLENQYITKVNEAFSANVAKEDALSSAASEVEQLKEVNANNIAKILELESQICSLKENLEKEHVCWRSAQNNYERQVILQSETIQELTRTSQALASLQSEMIELRNVADAFKSENELLKASWETERSSLLKHRDDAELKLKAFDEQNRILHRQLESLHLKFVDTGISTGSSDIHVENDLQSVVSYLRHSKEIAETEVSLLRQEKLRLQSQLDVALKSSEQAQAMLISMRENVKEHIHSDDEFNSLKLQVKEINLLREINAELRRESKHNFEECQKLHELVQNLKVEVERLTMEKDSATHDHQIEVGMLKSERIKLEQELSELNAKYGKIDVEEIEQVKVEHQRTLEKLKERTSDVDRLKRVLEEKEESLVNSGYRLAECLKDLDEHQKKISSLAQMESDIDQLVKEKENLFNENRSLYRQLEESLAGKKLNARGINEIMEMEKDIRIQALEKLMEKEKESLLKEKEEGKREKMRRLKNSKLMIYYGQILLQDKRKYEGKINANRSDVHSSFEGCGIAASQFPTESGLEERIASHCYSADKYEEAVDNVITDLSPLDPATSLAGQQILRAANRSGASAIDNDDLKDKGPIKTSSDVITDSSPLEPATSLAGQQILRAPNRSGASAIDNDDLKDKGPIKTSSDGRKTVRKLNRPRLKQSEESFDAESSEMEVNLSTEGKHVDTHNAVILPSSDRKRSISAPEWNDGIPGQETDMDTVHLHKKIRGSESPIKVSQREVTMEPVPSISMFPLVEDVLPKSQEAAELNIDVKTEIDAGSNQELDMSRYVPTPEMDVQVEADALLMSPDKQHQGMGQLEELQKGAEALQPSHDISAENETVDGEKPRDDFGMQSDEVESVLPESAAEEGEIACMEETLETSVPEVANNETDETRINEPGKTIQDQSASDFEEGNFDPPSDSQSEVAAPGTSGEVGEAQTAEGRALRTSSRLMTSSERRPISRPRPPSIPTGARTRGMVRGGRMIRGRGRGPNSKDGEKQG